MTIGMGDDRDNRFGGRELGEIDEIEKWRGAD